MIALANSSGSWAAQAGGSYLSIAMAWLAIPGPRPGFVFSTGRRETKWLEWTEDGRLHGLAKFSIGPNGLIDEEPIKAKARKKPCWTSSKQWRRA